MSNGTQPFPVRLEKAWHNLMVTIAKRNETDARNQQIAIQGILRVMRRK